MNIKNQFIMHLHDHFGLKFFLLKPPMNVDHGNFDNVSRAALDGSVDGIALCKTTCGNISRIDISQISSATQNCFYVFFLTRKVDGVVHVALYGKEFFEV